MMRSSPNKLVWILLGLAAAFLFVAVVFAAIYFLLQRQPSIPTAWRDPISGVLPAQVSPEFALYPLAGALPLETVDAAMASGDLETAYATLVFGLEASDAQRMGRLILLGRQFAAADKQERAGDCYRQVVDLAVLAPGLTDPARADALLNAGQGWAAIGQDSEALSALDQVDTIALQSPYLQMAQRRDLLAALEPIYRDLGADEAAQACRQKIVEWDQGVHLPPPSTALKLPALPLTEQPVSSAEVGALEEARRQAAYALLQGLPGGGDPPANLVSALAEALKAEDTAKVALYQQELAATSQPSRRIDVDWHLIRWLTIRYQVASRAFGLSIVPEWEAAAPDVKSALSTAYEDLLFDYEDLVTALPDASLIGPGSYQVRRLGMLAGRLGQYPNYPEQQMAGKIEAAVQNLIAAGYVDQLYVDVTAGDGGLHFHLSPATEYGVPAQGP
jgi:tetratricopeptide (TPR) repeat protein